MRKLINKKVMGFTLVELMVVVAIVGLVMTFALPSFQATGANARADSIHKQMLGDISFSRNTARDLSSTVRMIPQNDDWNDGWIISVVGGAPVRVRAALEDQIDITSGDFSAGTPIEFNNLGRATNVGSITITTTGCTGDRIRTLTLNVMGQIRTLETGPCPQ